MVKNINITDIHSRIFAFIGGLIDSSLIQINDSAKYCNK